MALDWRPKKVSKETAPSPKHVHRLEEGDQGLTDGLHTKVRLTVVEPNLGYLPREEDYQSMPATKGHATNAASQMQRERHRLPVPDISPYNLVHG